MLPPAVTERELQAKGISRGLTPVAKSAMPYWAMEMMGVIRPATKMGVLSVFVSILQVRLEMAPATPIQGRPPTETITSDEVKPVAVGSLSAKLRVDPEWLRAVTSLKPVKV